MYGNYYNNPYFANSYAGQMMAQNPMIQAPQMQQNPVAQNTPAQSSNNVIWVQGESGAKAYPVAPNSTVVLWDSENQVIYIKSADNSGMPMTRILDWTERNTKKNILETKQNPEEYVTRKEFDDVVDRLNSLSNRLNNNKQNQNQNKQKEEK